MGEHVVLLARFGELDAGDTGKAVSDQQPAKDVHFFLERELENANHDQYSGRDPCQARADRSRGERADGLVAIGMLGALAERGHLLGRIFLGGKHRPQHCHKQRNAPHPEADPHGLRNAARSGDVRHAPAIQFVRKDRTEHRTRADEGGLHGIAGGVLVLAQHVADEGPERLHGDVEAGVQRPQQHGGHEQLRR